MEGEFDKMYGYFSYYPTFPSLSAFANAQPLPRFTYPAVETKIFSHSIKSIRPLMEQGRILLDRLDDPSFAHRMMEAAQKGNKTEVERLVKSIGLTAAAKTHYTPSGIVFTLYSLTDQHTPCCTITFSLKWGG